MKKGRKKLLRYFIVFLILVLVYYIGHYLSFLNYNDKAIIDVQAYKEENEILKKELKQLEDNNGFLNMELNHIIARVINRDIHSFYNEIVIDRTDIEEGSGVINDSGLVGIVFKKNKNTSNVKLLSSDANLSVKINDSYGVLNNGKVKMLNKDSIINQGDKVYTSGLTQIPANIYVGEVISVNLSRDNLSYEATIKLINNDNLNYVAVIQVIQ